MRQRPCLACGLAGLMALAAMPVEAETIRISVNKLTFSPAAVSARVGDTIEWVNVDFIVHTATARDRQWDISIPAKSTGRVTLTRAGVIDYYCRYHPNMTGRISVAAP
jgi:plastocyanin